MADRKSFIDSGILEHGLNSSEMNNALKQAGYSPLNKIEQTLIDSGKYGTSGWERTVENAKEITGGLSTLVSGIFKNPKGMLKEGTDYVKSHSLPQIMGDFASAALSPVQLDPESIGTNLAEGGVKGVAEGVIAGAVTNPVDAAILAMPAVGRISKAGIQRVARLKNLPKFIKEPLRGAVTPEGRAVNQILRDSKQTSNITIENLKAQNTRIQNASTEDLAQAVRNLERGTVEGSAKQIELTNELKQMTSSIDDLLTKAGFNPEISRAETINQYVTRYFQDKGIDIPTSRVSKLYRETKGKNQGDLSKSINLEELQKSGIDPTEFENVIRQGYQLYNDGFIKPIRHKSTAQSTREGFVSEGLKKNLDKDAKVYGTQSYEDVAQGIKSGAYDNIIRTLGQSESSLTALDEMAKTVGRKIGSLDELAEGEVAVSPRLLREKMGTSLASGENINSPLESLTRGLNKAEAQIYQDDMLAMSTADLKALQNAYIKGSRNIVGGVAGDLARMAKTIALATPRYISGNVTTNLWMNPITGTTLKHYTKAILNKEDIPEILRRTASYSGYLEDVLPVRSGYKEIYQRLYKDLREGSPTKKLEAINAMVNTPLFKTANTAETIQRAAEYFNQAEKYAREINQPLKEVLRKAKANNGINETYRAINDRVQQVLGDYTGQNYYLPREATQLLNTMLPFYRPYTQAPRQFFNATTNYPIGVQAGAMVPSQIGQNISETAQEMYGIEPYQSQGGYPVLAPDWKNPGRVIYNQYHPFAPLGEVLNNPNEVLQGNPFLGALTRIASGKTRFNKEPLPPNTYRMYDGSMVTLDNNGNVAPYEPEQHPVDAWKFRASEILKTFTPVAGINNYVLPNLAYWTNQSYTKPADTVPLGQIGNLIIPGLMEGGTGRKATTPEEIILPQLGFNFTDTYPQRNGEYTPAQVKRVRKQVIKKQDRLDRR